MAPSLIADHEENPHFGWPEAWAQADRAPAEALPATRLHDAHIAVSEPMRALQKHIDTAAHSDAPLLVTGESGSGKGAIARRLHAEGARAAQPFVAVRGAALPAELGARFEEARGGVLLLDEIGPISHAAQTALLHWMDLHTATPFGQPHSSRRDVRLIATTRFDLARAEAEGGFRTDLRARLAALHIHVPPLRERLADIIPLAEHFLRQVDSRRQLSREAAQRLMGHGWHGNVRELREVIERAAAATPNALLEACDLDLSVSISASPAMPSRSASARAPVVSLPDAVASLERRMITEALQRTAGNRAEAARVLGIRRQLLYAKLAALGLGLGRSAEPSV